MHPPEEKLTAIIQHDPSSLFFDILQTSLKWEGARELVESDKLFDLDYRFNSIDTTDPQFRRQAATRLLFLAGSFLDKEVNFTLRFEGKKGRSQLSAKEFDILLQLQLRDLVEFRNRLAHTSIGLSPYYPANLEEEEILILGALADNVFKLVGIYQPELLEGVDFKQYKGGFGEVKAKFYSNIFNEIKYSALERIPPISPTDEEAIMKLLCKNIYVNGTLSENEMLMLANMSDALRYADQFKESDLTVEELLQIYKIIGRGDSIDSKYLGRLRSEKQLEEVSVTLGGSLALPASEVTSALQSLLVKLNSLKAKTDVPVLEDNKYREVAEIIIEFQKIHPTPIGTKRLGYILGHIALLKLGLLGLNEISIRGQSYSLAVTLALSGHYEDLVSLIKNHQRQAPENPAVEEMTVRQVREQKVLDAQKAIGDYTGELLNYPYIPGSCLALYDGWARTHLPFGFLQQMAKQEEAVDNQLLSFWAETGSRVGLLFQDVLNIPPELRKRLALDQAQALSAENSIRKRQEIINLIQQRKNLPAKSAEEVFDTELENVKGKTVIAKNIYDLDQLTAFLKSGNLWQEATRITKPTIGYRATEAKLGTRALGVMEDPTVLYGVLTDDIIDEINLNQPIFKGSGVFLIGDNEQFQDKTIFCDRDTGSGGGIGLDSDKSINSSILDWQAAEVARVERKLFPDYGWYVEAQIMGGWTPGETEKVIITEDIAKEGMDKIRQLMHGYPEFSNKFYIFRKTSARNELIPMSSFFSS